MGAGHSSRDDRRRPFGPPWLPSSLYAPKISNERHSQVADLEGPLATGTLGVTWGSSPSCPGFKGGVLPLALSLSLSKARILRQGDRLEVSPPARSGLHCLVCLPDREGHVRPGAKGATFDLAPSWCTSFQIMNSFWPLKLIDGFAIRNTH